MEKTGTNILRTLRREHGLSLENVAYDMKVSKHTVSRDEHKDIRKVDIVRLEQYASVYGTSFIALLGWHRAEVEAATFEVYPDKPLNQTQAEAINSLIRAFGKGAAIDA